MGLNRWEQSPGAGVVSGIPRARVAGHRQKQKPSLGHRLGGVQLQVLSPAGAWERG